MEALVSQILNAIKFVNDWLAVEIELLLPAMVLVALADLAVDRIKFKKRSTEDRLLLFAAFVIGGLLQLILGSNESILLGVKSALYLGSISAIFHYGVRDYLFSFVLDFVPWLFNTAKKALKRKVAILFGVNIEEELLGEEEEDG